MIELAILSGMKNLDVRTAETFDELGRSRFHGLDPGLHLHGQYPYWYYNIDSHGAKHVSVLPIQVCIDLRLGYVQNNKPYAGLDNSCTYNIIYTLSVWAIIYSVYIMFIILDKILQSLGYVL